MIPRALLVATIAAIAAAPSTAAADCIATCGDICYAPESTAFYRAEVLTVADGYAQRVRLVERLAGDNVGAVGDERADIYAEQQVAVGDFLFVSLAAYTDGTPGDYVWNVSRLIDNNEIMCDVEGRSVAVDQFAAMAASPDCPRIRTQLQLTSPPCDDTVGDCNAGGPMGLGGVAIVVLSLRRRRKA